MDEDHAHWTADEVTKWLDEVDSPPLPRDQWEEKLPEDAPRYRGSPRWYEMNVAPDEEILKEHPATARLERQRRWSERWGWVYDLLRCLAARYKELWTPEFIIGLCLLWYGLSMTAMVWTLGSYALSHPAHRRTLPTVEEIMQSEPHDEGSPNLTDEHP